MVPEKIFGNFFDDNRITPARLRNFAEDVLVRLSRANGTGDYAALINNLSAVFEAFSSGLTEIDSSLNHQKAKTQTLDEVIHQFKTTMSEMEGVIAHALGGFNSPAYTAFYPNGIRAYTAATKTQMPLLIKRISKEAATFAVPLGSELSLKLQSFETLWREASTSQATVKAKVSGGRSTREQDRAALEIALLTCMHAVGQKFPGNLMVCMSFFNFSLLFSQPHTKEKIAGSNGNSLHNSAELAN